VTRPLGRIDAEAVRAFEGLPERVALFWVDRRRGLLLRGFRPADLDQIAPAPDFADEMLADTPHWNARRTSLPNVTFTIAKGIAGFGEPLASAGLEDLGEGAWSLWAWCGRLTRGQWGFATACVRLVLDLCDDDPLVRRIEAYTRADRPVALAYLKRLGFEWINDAQVVPPAGRPIAMRHMVRTRTGAWTR
jgi:RimJ/RimL family protein N-acetyltransferase